MERERRRSGQKSQKGPKSFSPFHLFTFLHFQGATGIIMIDGTVWKNRSDFSKALRASGNGSESRQVANLLWLWTMCYMRLSPRESPLNGNKPNTTTNRSPSIEIYRTHRPITVVCSPNVCSPRYREPPRRSQSSASRPGPGCLARPAPAGGRMRTPARCRCRGLRPRAAGGCRGGRCGSIGRAARRTRRTQGTQ
eukprot:1194697-Prorocentrum_minimum.AAC.4